MSGLDVGFRFELSCRCASCEWSMPLDELKAKGGKHARHLQLDGVSVTEVVAPDGACPRCGGGRFILRFSM